MTGPRSDRGRRRTDAARRPKILFLSQCLPYPPHSGVCARTFNILEQLRGDFGVTLLAFSRRGHQTGERARRESERALAARLDHVDPAVPIPSEQSRIRRPWDHVRSLLTRRAYTYYEYDSPVFRWRLRRLVAQTAFDLVHLDSPDLHGWLPELPPVPVTCTHHSVESQLLLRQAQWIDLPPLRRYLTWQARRLEEVERWLGPSVNLNVMMSRGEAAALRMLAPGSRTAVVPNGVDTAFFTPAGVPPVEGRVAFVGSAHTFPNRDAMNYLLGAIWPQIQRADTGFSLDLIGAGTEAVRARYRAVAGVRALGHVPDVRPHLAEAACCVVPLRAGGGTRLKILDAWAMGKAVVSTSIGCEGLDAVDGENILVRDEPDALAAAVAADVDAVPALVSEMAAALDAPAPTTPEGYDFGNLMPGDMERDAELEALAARRHRAGREVRLAVDAEPRLIHPHVVGSDGELRRPLHVAAHSVRTNKVVEEPRIAGVRLEQRRDPELRPPRARQPRQVHHEGVARLRRVVGP